MKQHGLAILIKFLAVSVLLFVVLGLAFRVNFFTIFGLSVVLTLAAYLLGDMVVLPRNGNLTTAIIDFALAFFLIWSFGSIFSPGTTWFTASFISAILIGVYELMFHKFLWGKFVWDKQSV